MDVTIQFQISLSFLSLSNKSGTCNLFFLILYTSLAYVHLFHTAINYFTIISLNVHSGEKYFKWKL